MANHYQSLILSIAQQPTEQAWLEFKHKLHNADEIGKRRYLRLPMALVWLTRSNDKHRKNKVCNLLKKCAEMVQSFLRVGLGLFQISKDS